MRTWVSLCNKTQKEHCISTMIRPYMYTYRHTVQNSENAYLRTFTNKQWICRCLHQIVNDSVYLLALVRQMIRPLLATLSAVSIRVVRLSCCNSVILHSDSTAATSPCRMLQHSGSSRGLGGPTAARADMSCRRGGETAWSYRKSNSEEDFCKNEWNVALPQNVAKWSCWKHSLKMQR